MLEIYRLALLSTISSCPCCGSTDVYFKVIDEITKKTITILSVINPIPYMEKVGCNKCGLNMERKPNCNIIKQWNTRAK